MPISLQSRERAKERNLSCAPVSADSGTVLTDEIECIQREAEKLHKQGVKIIIAMGHSGYIKDQEIAAKVPLVRMVVGGHSHTYLSSGKAERTGRTNSHFSGNFHEISMDGGSGSCSQGRLSPNIFPLRLQWTKSSSKSRRVLIPQS